MTSKWFQVDPQGLAQLVRLRGKVVAAYELLANAWDTGANEVQVTFTMVGRSAHIVVEDDDPDGFQDLAHAYTLFACSSRGADAEKRGRFNLGEKIAIALCREAQIETTSGSVFFHSDGTMERTRGRIPSGSRFKGSIPMTKAEFRSICEGVVSVIPPIPTLFNGNAIEVPTPIACFDVALPTVATDEEGVLRDRLRKTTVRVYAPKEGGMPMLYEMGIPICEWDTFTVDIGQKVPLGVERDNVPQGFRRALRAALLNHCATLIPEEDSTHPWVTEALEHPKAQPDAIRNIISARFGEDAVAFDPSDVEASHRATAKGWAVVGGRSFSKAAWTNIRNAGALPPAGKKLPTPTPYSQDPRAPSAKAIPQNEWTAEMKEVADIACYLAKEAGVCESISVNFIKGMRGNFRAAWTKGGFLDFNMSQKTWLETWRFHRMEFLDLLIHEFAHERESSHLGEKFHRACTHFGAAVALVLAEGNVPHWS